MADRGQRFPLPPGVPFPEMLCGVNQQRGSGVQTFRPSYFTAKWATDGSALIEVAIWGPRVLDDGTLGKRILDHCWRTPKAQGGVNLADVPSSIAAVVREYAARNRLSV